MAGASPLAGVTRIGQPGMAATSASATSGQPLRRSKRPRPGKWISTLSATITNGWDDDKACGDRRSAFRTHDHVVMCSHHLNDWAGNNWVWSGWAVNN
ncbi:hypothetical protein GCM10017767_24670 [Halomonas urumqiensis]|nr:hypothetical protein GCM10017767_24670 [Halomonas urumqiensis]